MTHQDYTEVDKRFNKEFHNRKYQLWKEDKYTDSESTCNEEVKSHLHSELERVRKETIEEIDEMIRKTTFGHENIGLKITLHGRLKGLTSLPKKEGK
jgi:hypothetical protein